MATYKNTDKIISHLNDEIEACGNPDSDNEPIAYGTKLGLLSAKAFIETAETIDVQEIVRCKDCKHATFYSCKNDACYKRILCDYEIQTDDENFYCAYGERNNI